MNIISSQAPSTADTAVITTADARLIAYTWLPDFMSPCIICPPSSGKMGNIFSTVHQQLISMRKKKRNMVSAGYVSTASAGRAPKAKQVAYTVPTAKLPT